jgi:broad specificity phosphatase PhoE
MGQILLIRHAQASFGADDYDVLSPLGHEQSTILGRRVRAIENLTGIVHGAMRRQQHTAELVVTELDDPPPVTEDARWDEYDHEALLESSLPTQEEKDVFAEAMAAAADQRRFFAEHFDMALRRWAAGGHELGRSESYTAFADRVQTALRGLLADADGTVVVVTSGGVISVVCAQLLGLSTEHWARLSRVIVNTGITKLVQGRSGLNLITVNDHAHLESSDGRLITYR